jgi:hypothetical protein
LARVEVVQIDFFKHGTLQVLKLGSGKCHDLNAYISTLAHMRGPSWIMPTEPR